MTKINILITLSIIMFSPIFSEEKEVELEKLEKAIVEEVEKMEDEIENDIKIKLGIEFDKVHDDSENESVTIGVYLSDLDFEEAYEKHYNECYGVRVSSLVDGGNAEKDGILADDIIMEFGGVKVMFEEHLLKLKKDYKIGDSVTIKVFRNGEIRDIDLNFRAKVEDVDIEFTEHKLSAGYGGGGPMVFMPQFDYSGINNYITQFGFDPIPMEAGTHFGGYGMGTVGGGWFIGGMGGGMVYSQSFTIDSTGHSRNINLESGLGGVTISKKLPLFTENLILDFTTLLGGGETALTISQHSGNFSWDNTDISNGNNWSATYKKNFFALYPTVGLLVRLKPWLGIHASAGNLYALSTDDNWTVKNKSINTVNGNSPDVPNGLTYSIGIFFGH